MSADRRATSDIVADLRRTPAYSQLERNRYNEAADRLKELDAEQAADRNQIGQLVVRVIGQDAILAPLHDAWEAAQPVCVIEVGHPSGTLATWTSPGIAVCDRHRSQYDERDDLGPFDWVPVQPFAEWCKELAERQIGRVLVARKMDGSESEQW